MKYKTKVNQSKSKWDSSGERSSAKSHSEKSHSAKSHSAKSHSVKSRSAKPGIFPVFFVCVGACVFVYTKPDLT